MSDAKEKPPQVSRAPAVIKPLGGTGPVPSSYIGAGSNSPPEWDFWKQKLAAHLWEAVALTCNMNPRKGRFADWFERRGTSLPSSSQDGDYRIFEDRLEIACESIDSIETVEWFANTESRRIGLESFKAFADSLSWEVPSAFSTIGEAAVKPQLLAEPAQSATEKAPDGREHVSNKLAYLNQAADKFWARADRHDRSTHPDNATVVSWLTQHDFSETLAEKGAAIIRPEWAPTGRKPEGK